MTHKFDGKKYEKASAHQKEWGTRLITEVGLQGAETVLDLGCGDGALTAQIADLVQQGEVLGIDASQGMIDAARPKERKNLTFRKMDINELEFRERFDLVISNATLHWVKDHAWLLKNVRLALRSGGHLRFNFAGDGNCSNFFSVVKEAMVRDEFKSFFAGFEWPWYMPTVDAYKLLAESSELQDVRVWGENADRFFQGEEAMIRWIDQPSLVPFVVHVPDPVKNSFRNFVVNRMIEKTKQSDGTCFETFRRINISAMK